MLAQTCPTCAAANPPGQRFCGDCGAPLGAAAASPAPPPAPAPPAAPAAGDLVNTASRVQSVAEPGTVLVGEATRRSSEDTIVYEDAGLHELKGKDGEISLWKALRVVSGRQGSLKSTRLEAPFVGRARE